MRVVGILGGEGYPNGELNQWLKLGEWICIADAGVKHFYEGIPQPKFIIGDLDSQQDSSNFKEVERLIFKDQTISDCDKLLSHCRTLGAGEVILVCAHGGRLDHQLDILNSLARNGFVGPIVYPEELVYVLTPGKHQFNQLIPNQRVSLFALGEAGAVSTVGLKWELPLGTLSSPTIVSLSNQLVQNFFSLEFSIGNVILIIERMPGVIPNWFK